jgi:ABC-type spermidine/putrescine transport system permease subunit II
MDWYAPIVALIILGPLILAVSNTFLDSLYNPLRAGWVGWFAAGIAGGVFLSMADAGYSLYALGQLVENRNLIDFLQVSGIVAVLVLAGSWAVCVRRCYLCARVSFSWKGNRRLRPLSCPDPVWAHYKCEHRG